MFAPQARAALGTRCIRRHAAKFVAARQCRNHLPNVALRVQKYFRQSIAQLRRHAAEKPLAKLAGNEAGRQRMAGQKIEQLLAVALALAGRKPLAEHHFFAVVVIGARNTNWPSLLVPALPIVQPLSTRATS